MIRLLREKYRQVPAYLYLFFMCSLFLFYWDNYYFNITVTRYRFFRYASIALIIAYVAVALIEAVIKVKAHENIKEWIKNTVEHFWQSLNIVDLSLLLFLLVSYVSYYINSEYRYEIWEGNAGRYMGVEVYTLLVCAYFLISRHVYKVKPVILCFSAAVCVISILTVLNFFMIDPLGFTINLKESSERIFLSTIGNINFLSSLLCIAYPITGFLYIACEHQKERIYYLLCSVLSFIAVVLASSDSGFLGCGFFLFVCYVIVCKNYERTLRFLVLCCASLAGGKLITMMVSLYPNEIHELSVMSELLCGSLLTWALLIGLLVWMILWVSFRDLIQAKLHKLPLRRILIGGFLVIVLLAVGTIYYFTCIDTQRDLGSLSNYLRFNDRWGTGRGYIWGLSLKVFREDFTFAQKLIGFGPATFYFAVGSLLNDLTNTWDNAHSEYVQYLMTIGIAGLGVYLVFIITMVKEAFQRMYRNHMYLIALGLGFVSYVVQAGVNLNQILTTPVFFMVASMMRGILLRMDEKKERYRKANLSEPFSEGKEAVEKESGLTKEDHNEDVDQMDPCTDEDGKALTEAVQAKEEESGEACEPSDAKAA